MILCALHADIFRNYIPFSKGIPLRASAHERFFAAAAKQPQRRNTAALSWLCARTVKKRNVLTFSSLFVSVRYGFCRVGCCVRSSAKNQDKEKKEVVGTSSRNSKTTERAVPQIV